MRQDGSAGANRVNIVLTGLIAGVSLALLNSILCLFFVFPMVANHLFHTYLRYDANVASGVAEYVAFVGMVGMIIGLFVSRRMFVTRPEARALPGAEDL